MDEHRGLRAITPDEGIEVAEGPAEPAAATAMRLLLEAEQLARSEPTPSAGLLAMIAQGWATLALTEPLASTGETGACPHCDSLETVVLPTDWQAAVAAGHAVAIVGCGSPWHYVFPT